ncbi:MAG: divergent PAP2 family protein [Defluviitaleaceae bacterium]|nr:divergent PAP2 family protein [Defluviitaleaceae bacterium]
MSTFFSEISKNTIFLSAVTSWLIAQIIKIIIELFRTKKFKLSLILSSGGMPSSHTSFIIALAVSVGFQEGFDSVLFAIAGAISLVVMYDAQGVRRAAGKQAAIINTMLENIENTGIKVDKKLKELLGHSPIEVVFGAILGIIIASLFSR